MAHPRTPLLDRGDPEAKREEIQAYLHATFDVYEQLFETLAGPEAFYRRADPLRHPLIFYYGHTAVFFVNKLVLAKLLPRRIHPEYEAIFAIGVDEMSWDDLNETHYDWPTVEAVRAYRQEVRAAVDQAIRTLPLTLPIDWQSAFWPIVMGIEHERIHLETSTMLIRQLPLEHVRPHPSWSPCPSPGDPPVNELLPVPGARVRQGKTRPSRLYGWDNEYGHLETDVVALCASKHLVSNREFQVFVEAGGYRDASCWTDEGWSWRTYQQAERPRFWIQAAGEPLRLRTMLEEVPMPWAWPVEVNHLEAKAFCNWKARRSGKPVRLPTEAEWLRLAAHAEVCDQPEWGERAPGNLNLDAYRSPCPVGEHRFGDFSDVVGNVWQWTETPIAGLPGFEVHPLYDDFSTPTFDTLHTLFKGGSWVSTGNEATLDARYAFRRHFFQYAGIRYVETDAPVPPPEEIYETDPEVVSLCDLHYGADRLGVQGYPRALAREVLQRLGQRPTRRALLLGCGVGRTAFELAAGFDRVTALDVSARTIKVGVSLQQKGVCRYVLPTEGELVSYHEARLADLGLDEAREKVELLQADPCNLKPLFTGYDLILVDGVLERAYDPSAILDALPARLTKDGLLVISSCYDWRPDRTKRERWLGGFKEAGESLTTREGLRAALAPTFELAESPVDLPCVTRIHARRYEHAIYEVTVWVRSARS